MARLNLATSLAHLGAPDEAATLGKQALIAAGKLNFVRPHARDLNAALISRYPTLSCVRNLQEQYHQLVRHSILNAG
ncbi:MAG: hypothetical protein ACT4NY_12560 [Pseudonocardiales bacterium]